jgi:hypothetical protein
MSKSSLTKQSQMLRPLSRKDIFYSGSVANLPEFRQSQQSLTAYRHSVISLPKLQKANSEIDAGHQYIHTEDSGELICKIIENVKSDGKFNFFYLKVSKKKKKKKKKKNLIV